MLKVFNDIRYRELAVSLCVLVFWVFGTESAYSQHLDLDRLYANPHKVEASRLRKILNKFSWTFSAGYGVTAYNIPLDGFNLVDQNDVLSLELGRDEVNKVLMVTSNWLTGVGEGQVQESGANITEGAGIRYRGYGKASVFDVSVSYDWKFLKIGGGLSHYFQVFKGANSVQGSEERMKAYDHDFRVRQWAFYGSLAGEYFDFGGFFFMADIRAGTYKMGSVFDKKFIKDPIFFEFGLPVEREFSEYFRVFFRPAYQLKSYVNNFSEESVPGLKIDNNQWIFSFGIRLKIPEVPRCKLPYCGTRVKHRHRGREYRGQPVFLPQDPKMGQIPKSIMKYRRSNNPFH
ncbi:MAG: hypothetical protein MI784_02310 [Cytophagales bacterium]|nr:hypothetical protein [Cytophagales bacterium]